VAQQQPTQLARRFHLNRPRNKNQILLGILGLAALTACQTGLKSSQTQDLESPLSVPTLQEIQDDHGSEVDLSSSGYGKYVFIPTIYDSNDNGRYDSGDVTLSNFGLRLTPVKRDQSGAWIQSQASKILRTPRGNHRWNGVFVRVDPGNYRLDPIGVRTETSTDQAVWKTNRPIIDATGDDDFFVSYLFAACQSNGLIVPFPDRGAQSEWACRPELDLLPRASLETTTPVIRPGQSAVLRYQVSDEARVSLTPGFNHVRGYSADGSFSLSVAPTQTTTYTLRARNEFGTRIASVTITVDNGPPGDGTVITEPNPAKRQLSRSFKFEFADIKYLVYLPAKYGQTPGKRYPTLLWLHAVAESGTNTDSLLKNEDRIPATLINEGFDFSFKVKNQDFNYIVVSPILPFGFSSPSRWEPKVVQAIVDHVKTTYLTDSSRSYLAGFSFGGGGVENFLSGTNAQGVRNADQFAAAVSISGSLRFFTDTLEDRTASSYDFTKLGCNIAASKLPFWGLHSKIDDTVPVVVTTKVVNAINACQPQIPAKQSLYEDLSHTSTSIIAHDPSTRVDGQNIYEWMLNFTR
jgi:hypothetical protein